MEGRGGRRGRPAAGERVRRVRRHHPGLLHRSRLCRHRVPRRHQTVGQGTNRVAYNPFVWATHRYRVMRYSVRRPYVLRTYLANGNLCQSAINQYIYIYIYILPLSISLSNHQHLFLGWRQDLVRGDDAWAQIHPKVPWKHERGDMKKLAIEANYCIRMG